MIKFVNKTYEIIKNILNGNALISARNMKVLFSISTIYALIWIIFVYSPHEWILLFTSPIIVSDIIYAFLSTTIYMILVYLPEMIISLLDFLIKKIKNKNYYFRKIHKYHIYRRRYNSFF